MATIPKRVIVERIALKTGARKNQVKDTIQSFLDLVVDELARGNRFEFREFGVFQVVLRKDRLALNPKTMQKVSVPSKAVVVFKPGKTMKARVQKLQPNGDKRNGSEQRRPV
jgi:integration host factor subunit beta